MKAVIQRVLEANVNIAGDEVGRIGAGLVILLGVAEGDSEQDLDWLLQKILRLRIFADAAGKMNLSVQDKKGEILWVSQFTLLADTSAGNRPAFTGAAKPAFAEMIYEKGKAMLSAQGMKWACGRFGADMRVGLVNDGPVTIILDSREK